MQKKSLLIDYSLDNPKAYLYAPITGGKIRRGQCTHILMPGHS